MDIIDIIKSIGDTFTRQDSAIAIQAVTNIITAFSALIVIWAAFTWKQQFKYSKRFDLAEELVTSFHQVESSLVMIRNSVITENEKQKISNSEFNYLPPDKMTTIFLYRLNLYDEPIGKFISLKPRLELAFGINSCTFYKDFLSLYQNIIIAAGRVSAYEDQHDNYENLTEDQKTKKREASEKANNYLWSGYSQNDPVKTKLEEIKTQLNTLLDKYNLKI